MPDILALKCVFLTKPVTSGILFSTSLIFVFTAAVITRLLISSILFSTSPIFSPNLFYLRCIDLSEFKVDASRILFSKLFAFVSSLYCTSSFL